jgi:Mg2+/citrate symporter
MRLIKMWLTTRNVIITNDVLAEMQIFAGSVDGSNVLRELALEVLQLIPNKVPFLLVIVGNGWLTTKYCKL